MNEQEPTFEANLKNLQDTVNKLESGNVPLDDAIKKYKYGSVLASRLHSQLVNAKRTIAHIVDSRGHETVYSRDENGQDANNNMTE